MRCPTTSTGRGTEARTGSRTSATLAPGFESTWDSHSGLAGDSPSAGSLENSCSEHLKLLDPPFTTRIRMSRSRGPLPVANLRHVVAVLGDIQLMLDQPVSQELLQLYTFTCQTRDPVDHVDHQMKAIQVVQHGHVEGRRRCALLLVAAHVQIVVIRAPIGQAMEQPWIAMVGEHDRL